VRSQRFAAAEDFQREHGDNISILFVGEESFVLRPVCAGVADVQNGEHMSPSAAATAAHVTTACTDASLVQVIVAASMVGAARRHVLHSTFPYASLVDTSFLNVAGYIAGLTMHKMTITVMAIISMIMRDWDSDMDVNWDVPLLS
jgi:hypothetical protein